MGTPTRRTKIRAAFINTQTIAARYGHATPTANELANRPRRTSKSPPTMNATAIRDPSRSLRGIPTSARIAWRPRTLDQTIEPARRKLSERQHADSEIGIASRTNGTTEKNTAEKLVNSRPINRARSAGVQAPERRWLNTETIPENPAIAIEISARVDGALS